MNMILHKKFGIVFPAKHFKITWKFIFWQTVYYCVMFLKILERNCLQQYNIDPCYYFSAPHFTFDAFLRHSSLTLELLSDINQYLFIIKGIRGGMSMVSKRYALANNKYVEGYNSSKSSSFILYLDAKKNCMVEPCKNIYLGKILNG